MQSLLTIWRQSCVFAVVFCACVIALQSQAATRKPNVIVFLADDLGYQELGCYGQKYIKTPNIDWIADNGAICTSFYATSPVCSPSRAALVSGRYPQNTPVVQNNIPLSDDVVTFAEILRRKGHRLKELDDGYGNMQAVVWDRGRGEVSAVSDPRGIGV